MRGYLTSAERSHDESACVLLVSYREAHVLKNWLMAQRCGGKRGHSWMGLIQCAELHPDRERGEGEGDSFNSAVHVYSAMRSLW